MCFHPIVTVIGAQLQKFGQIFVPNIEINGHGSLSHTKLIDGHGSVIDQLHPSDYTSCRTFKTADFTAGGTHFTEIQPHSAAEFAQLREVIDTPIDAFETVRNSIYETTRQLMKRFAGIGQRGSSHRYLEFAQHIVELLYPFHPVVRLVHCQVQGDSEIHFLYGFDGFMRI